MSDLMINMKKYLIFCFSCQNKDILYLRIRKVWKAVLVFFVLSICNLPSVYSQTTRVVFSHLDINNGISDNWIKCIYKDSKGFIWIGTNNGLNRFDGYKFEIFQHEFSDSTTIADNDINVITSDKKGNLWISY